MKNNLWILTEERPKVDVLKIIFKRFALDNKCGFFGDTIRILPILDDDRQFTFTYEVIGFSCAKVNKVYIKTVSGYSSFVDYLIFWQEQKPEIKDNPIYAIEETKTDDTESRNTGVYQRCSKFVYIKSFYPNVKLLMLYNIHVEQKEKPSATNILGTRLLITYGVEILGKELDPNIFKPFSSIDELMDVKSNMRKPPMGNVPIMIKRNENVISISGRLYKNGGLCHDPNIGALSIISAVLRMLGWTEQIVITNHGLSQNNVGNTNKFIQIANNLNILLDGLNLPINNQNIAYWHYETKGEKLGTIFIHLVVESFTNGYSIFENHAGCEKGYFITKSGEYLQLAKYQNKELYKSGDKGQIIYIPDLILIDFERSEVINIEGKKYQFREKGIKELNNYDFIENNYIQKYYSNVKIIRTVVLYGSNNNEIVEIEVGFLLNEKGKLILGVQAPNLFKKAIRNLLDFWAQ
ncbi:MAG: hypothetical protein RSB34_05475 [Muribaculaceae bacterium]